MDLLGGNGQTPPPGVPTGRERPDPASLMLTGSPAPCPGLRSVLARAPEEDVLWRKAQPAGYTPGPVLQEARPPQLCHLPQNGDV